MPEVRASLFCRVDAFGSDPLRLRVQVQNEVDDPNGLRIDAEIDGTAGAMAVPITLSKQRAVLRAYVDGVLVPEAVAISVQRSRKANLQNWSITIPIHSGATGYAGDWRGRGVGLCKRRVDVFGEYLTSTGYHVVPLISNGIADNEERASNDGAMVTYTGVDRGGRYDQELIDFVLPPGSGLTRDRVIAIAARRAGVEDISLDPSPVQMMHEFQMADANFLPSCQELAETEGRQILWDRSGDMVWRQYGSGALVPSTARWAFTERHFVAGSGKLSQPGELITEITVEGDIQQLVGPCGDVTTRVTITSTSLAARVAQLYAQGSGSSYSSNPQPAPPTSPQTVKVETFDTTRRCGIVVYERRTVQEFFNPEVNRYTWDATNDEWDTIAGVYTDDNTDDDSPAYSNNVEYWTTTEIDETWHYWMRENFEGPEAFWIPLKPPGLDLGWGLRAPKGWDGLTNGTGFVPAASPDHSYDRKFEGCKIGTMMLAHRWKAPREYVKTRTVTSYPYDTWETVEPANGWGVLGSKEAVTDGGEQFILSDQIVTILGTDGRGYQTDEDEHRFEFFAPKGSQYLYGDDTERGEPEEELQYVGSTYTLFVGTGEETHNEFTTETNENDRVIRADPAIGFNSYLPAAERIPDSGPTQDSDVYEDEDELNELYRKAYRTESKPVSVTVTDDGLESCSTRGVHKVSAPYLESEDEADWLARWLLDEGSAGVFDGELAGANFFVEPGDWCSTIRYRQIGLAGCPGRIEEVSWDWKVNEPLNTKIQVLLYPEE